MVKFKLSLNLKDKLPFNCILKNIFITNAFYKLIYFFKDYF